MAEWILIWNAWEHLKAYKKLRFFTHRKAQEKIVPLSIFYTGKRILKNMNVNSHDIKILFPFIFMAFIKI